MFIQRTKPNGRVNPERGTYFAIYESKWDPKKKKNVHIKVEALGYAADIIARGHPDPEAYAQERLATLKQERESGEEQITVKLGGPISEDITLEEVEEGAPKTNEEYENRFNVGYAIPRRVYSTLHIDRFLKRRAQLRDFEYDANKIMMLLVFGRIIAPASKRRTYLGQAHFFEDFGDFSLDDVYHCLDFFAENSNDLQHWIYNHLGDLYTPDTSATLFDCTNYYFDISGPYRDTFDEFGNVVDEDGNETDPHYQKRGPEKNHRPDPIVEMGLLLDKNAFPLGYEMFPGNESEKTHMRPMLNRIRDRYSLGRMIVVADRGLNTSDNIYYLNGDNRGDNNEQDGYIYGQSIRGASNEFKSWVLNSEGWNTTDIPCEGKDQAEGKTIQWRHKSRVAVKRLQVNVGGPDGKQHKKTVRVDQKQMVYYSEKYAKREKRSRDEMIARAEDLIAHPDKYNKVTASGSASYIRNIAFNKDTGEVVEGKNLSLDLEKIREEEKYDGYYSIVTSELTMTDLELRNSYRELIYIEHTFRILKEELKARPIFVSTNRHIDGHFVVCYVALVILKIIERKLDCRYTIPQIIQSLRKYCCSEMSPGIYLFTYLSQVILAMEKKFNIVLNKKHRTRLEVRRLIGY